MSLPPPPPPPTVDTVESEVHTTCHFCPSPPHCACRRVGARRLLHILVLYSNLTLQLREYEMIYGGPGFPAVVWLVGHLLKWRCCSLVWRTSESVDWCIEGQAFSRSYDLAPRPPLPPPLQSATRLYFPVFLCISGRSYWRRGEGVGEEPDHTTARWESLALYKSVNTHWLYLTVM